MRDRERATIIGAGPAGLSLAYFLAQRGVQSTIITADSGAGGLARPLEFAGKLVDPGPHGFYSSYGPLAFDLLRSFFRADELHTLTPRRAVRTASFMAHAPVRARDLLNPIAIKEGLVLQIQQRSRANVPISPATSARERILRTRGPRFLDLFFDPWCRKHFGLGAEHLDASLVDLLAAERRQGDAGLLVHPRSGAIGELWLRMADHLRDTGTEFHYERSVSGIRMEQDRIVAITTTKRDMPVAGPLFSTAPLSVTAAWAGLPMAASTPRRSTILVLMRVERYRTKALYVTDSRVNEPIGRITFCDNWRHAPAANGPRMVCAEFWCAPGDGIHELPEQELVALVQRYLRTTGMAFTMPDPEYKVLGPMMTTPVPLRGYTQELNALRTSVGTVQGLNVLGRHANHRWDGVDDAIMEAHQLAMEHART